MLFVLLAGVVFQLLLFPFSRLAAYLAGGFFSLVLIPISLGKMINAPPNGFPAWLGLVLGFLWLLGVVLILRRQKDLALRANLVSISQTLVKLVSLCLAVVVLMALLVLPLVLLTIGQPLVFKSLSLTLLALVLILLLRRKYKTMRWLEFSDTRKNSSEADPGLLWRWSFRTLLRPMLIALSGLVFAFGLALLGAAPVIGVLFLAGLSLSLIWVVRLLRELPWMAGNK